MKYKPVRDRCCQNEKCRDHWKFSDGNNIRRSMYKTRQERRRRYLCKNGFEPYSWATKNLLSSICLYTQVIKKRRKNRVINVDRRLIIGTRQKMEQLLFESEDSSTINTSFIERLNLTIRQGCAYLGRRTACHSRRKGLLADNLALQMCYYNFVRRHSALKFGDEIRTPAMQAGLVKKQLSFREIFTAVAILFWWFPCF